MLVPSELRRQVAFTPFVEIAARHAGPDAVSLLSSYFVCGGCPDRACRSRGSHGDDRRGSRPVPYRAPSIDAAVANEVESTPLRERISDEVYERIRIDAREVFARYTADDGSLSTPFDVDVVVARRR